jgi:hypothetical protein
LSCLAKDLAIKPSASFEIAPPIVLAELGFLNRLYTDAVSEVASLFCPDNADDNEFCEGVRETDHDGACEGI